MILSAHASNGGPRVARPEPLTTRRMLKRLRKLLDRISLRELSRNQATVRKVHRLRVSTRKTLAALTVCEPLLSKSAARRIKKTLKAKRKALGRVRDWDVFISRVLCSPAAEKAETRCDLLLYLAGERERAWKRARKAWAQASKRVGKGIEKKQKSTLRTSGASESAIRLFQRAIREPLATIRQGVPSSDGEGANNMEALHRIRIACKTLRYLLEFRDDLTGQEPDAAPPSQAKELLAELQLRLGDLHDLSRRPKLLESGGYANNKAVRMWLHFAQERAKVRLDEELCRYLTWQSSVDIEAAFRDLDR